MNVLKRTAIGVVVVTSGCLGSNGSDRPKLSVQVAPLDLAGVDNVCYDVRVENDLGEVVWSLGDLGDTFAGGDTTTVCSQRYGNGEGGSIAYVGTCDATDANNADEGTAINTVTIWVDGIYGADGNDLGDWRDPCDGGCSLRRPCEENADTAVDFALTVMRRAQQGFFDIAVEFQDIFCSAKVDVVPELLHDNGVRGPTAVVGFACTSGDNSPTYLYLDPIVVTCGDGSGPYTVDPIGPGGNIGAVGEGLFQTAVYHDVEELPGLNKCFWNTSLGLDVETAIDLSRLGPNCTLVTEGTASETAFDEIGGFFVSPGGTAYPKIHFEVALTGTEGEALFGAHPLEGGNGVATAYSTVSDGAGDAYTFEMACGSDPVTAAPAGEPDCGNGVVEAGEQCDGGEGCVDCACPSGFEPVGTGCAPVGPDCGDGIVEGNEECEEPADNCDWAKCQCYPNFPSDGAGNCVATDVDCGNGIVDPDEECEPINAGCNTDCTCYDGWVPDANGGCTGCGNGVEDNGELCDPAFEPMTLGLNCDESSCTCGNFYQPSESSPFGCGYCGDFYLDGREQCDGTPNCDESCLCTTGQSTSGDSECITCGDGYVEGSEECEADEDAGGNCSECSCTNGYSTDGSGGCEYCGDLTTNGTEECDGGTNCFECSCAGSYEADGSNGCGYCGDLDVNGGEECDGGSNCFECSCAGSYEADGSNGCGYCGDLDVNGGEECDGGSNCFECDCPGSYMADGTNGCGYCGNNSVDGDEVCDGGTNCDTDCTCLGGYDAAGTNGCEYCGDLSVNGTEECDGGTYCDVGCVCAPGLQPMGGGVCACSDGMPPDPVHGCDRNVCGNAALDDGEACDWGDDANCDQNCMGCIAGYVFDSMGVCTTCGNGNVDGNEVCDTATDMNCESGCDMCSLGYVPSPDGTGPCTQCGNNEFESADEVCDPSLDANCDSSCSSCSGNMIPDGNGSCTECGNGSLDGEELCDPGLDANCDSSCDICNNNMVPDGAGGCELCGNGTWDEADFEDCDGSDNCDPDTCLCVNGTVPDTTGFCTFCGNGVEDAGEECDTAGSGGEMNCDETTCECVPPAIPSEGSTGCTHCGNGFFEPTESEECDSLMDPDGCNSFCECVDGFEASNGDGTCSLCGDGVVEGIEQCENTDGFNEACGTDCQCSPGFVPDENGQCVQQD